MSVFGERLKNLRESKKLTQQELAVITGQKSYTTITKWEKGENLPRGKELKILAEYFNVSTDYLLGMDLITGIEFIDESKTVQIPVLGYIACGEPILAEENISEYREVFDNDLPKGELFFLKAKGDSMEPKIPDGSYVMLRQQPDVENGEIAAVLVNGDTEATLKRVRKLDDTILLEALNEKYAPYIVNENNPARIIGKAIKVEFDL